MIDLTFPVSLFKGVDPTPIKTIPLINFFTVSSPALKEKVNRIRETEDKKERNKIKSTLPSITPSGCFSFRNLANQISHSGFICIDIDEVDDVEWCRLKLQELEYAAIVGLSSSGKGPFLICEIKIILS